MLFKNPWAVTSTKWDLLKQFWSFQQLLQSVHLQGLDILIQSQSRWTDTSKGMISSLDRLLAEQSSSLGLLWHVILEGYLSHCCLLMSLNRALEFLDYAKSSQWNVIQFLDLTLGCIRNCLSVSPVTSGDPGQLSACQRSSQRGCFTWAKLMTSPDNRRFRGGFPLKSLFWDV